MRGNGDTCRHLQVIEGHGVEEAQSAHDLADAGLETASDQVQLVVAHILQAQLVRRTAVEGAEAGDRVHVGLARAGGHVAQRHGVEHALAQWRDGLVHGSPLSGWRLGILAEGGGSSTAGGLAEDEPARVGEVILCCEVRSVALLSRSML